MNGIEVLRALRNGPTTGAIPVLMLSNVSEPGIVAEALRLGAAGYAVKSETTPARLVQLLGDLHPGPPSLVPSLAPLEAGGGIAL